MKICSKMNGQKGTYLFNEGKVVRLYFFNIDTNFALTIKVIFTANKKKNSKCWSLSNCLENYIKESLRKRNLLE